VDYDPVVLAHARALLISSAAGATDYIDADLRDTGMILARAAELLDFSRPVAVTLVAILHAIPDADGPHAIVARLMDAVPPGSYLAISHAGSDLIDQETQDGLREVAGRVMQQKPWYRSREQVAQFFEGMDLVQPGLVRVEEWRPDPGTGETGRSSLWCAVGRKRLYSQDRPGPAARGPRSLPPYPADVQRGLGAGINHVREMRGRAAQPPPIRSGYRMVYLRGAGVPGPGSGGGGTSISGGKARAGCGRGEGTSSVRRVWLGRRRKACAAPAATASVTRIVSTARAWTAVWA
jgi:S-adenosyl methyltransferase